MQAGNWYALDYDCLHGLAHYEIALLDPSYKPKAMAFLKDDLVYFEAQSQVKPFHSPPAESFGWGSAYEILGAAIEALWYEDLSGDRSFKTLALSQRDYFLGGNPWDVCFVSGLGSIWAKHPHHQVADLSGVQFWGLWGEGPMLRPDWRDLGVDLSLPDKYAAFQSAPAVYHDDVEDYATNKPTITINSFGLTLASWYASPVYPFTSRDGE